MDRAARDLDPSPRTLRAAREPAALADVLTALGDRIAPVAMARDRILPVADRFVDLLADGGGQPGLVRGRIWSCAGGAATTLALSLIAPAVAAGSWVAVVDVPTIGVDAASELGIALERLVAIDTTSALCAPGTSGDDGGQHWADVVAAAADGFDLLLVRVPEGIRSATVRKVTTRLQQRGVVMVVLGEVHGFVCDGELTTAAQSWSGLGDGWGYLRRRSVDVEASGRRVPGRRCRTLAFPPVDAPTRVPVDLPAHAGTELSTAS